MEIIGALMMVGMFVVGPTISGYKAVETKASLTKQAKEAREQTEKFNETMEKYRRPIKAITEEMKAVLDDNWDKMTQIRAQIRVAKAEHSKAYRTIQMWGLIMVIWMGFLLLLKKFIQLWKQWK